MSWPSSSTTSSANASPADGPADRAGVDLHGERQLHVRRLVDHDADQRPAVRALDRPDLDLAQPLARADPEPHGLAGLVRRDQRAQIGGFRTGCPSAETMTSVGLEPALAAGESG